MRITVIGAGYVGLVTGTCLADFGHEVICVDTNLDRVDALIRGEVPIYEPGLSELVQTNVGAGRLSFSTSVLNGIPGAEVVFLAVGTPSRRGDGHADLAYVYQAARELADWVNEFTVVVIKSTVPVGTGDEVARIIAQKNPSADVAVVSNPEFLREGAAIDDFKRPDRIVIGTDDERAHSVMREVYRQHLSQAPLLFTSRRAAELIKYAANAFLAMKVTFINEIADLCEVAGADVQQVAHGMGLDPRIGSDFLQAGPGYGGSCFPKDTLALVKIGQDLGSPLRLVETTIAINEQRKRDMSGKVIEACAGDVRGKTIGVLGLTFKPNTDDMREAPSIAIIQDLADHGARIVAYDPQGSRAARAIFGRRVEFVENAYAVADSADAVVLITEWNEFRSLDLGRIKAAMKQPVLVDLRNVYRAEEAGRHGFAYSSIGRPLGAIGTPADVGE